MLVSLKEDENYVVPQRDLFYVSRVKKSRTMVPKDTKASLERVPVLSN